MKKTSNQSKNESTHSVLLSLGIWFAILCWGGAYVAARFLLHPETTGLVALSPLLLAAIRFSIAAIFFAVPFTHAMLYQHISARTLISLAMLGQLTFTLYYWLQYIGIERTNAGISAILGVGLIPLFTTVLAPFFRQGRLTFPLVALLLLGFFGVVLIVFQHSLPSLVQSGFLLGAGCLIANTLLFALYNNISKQWMQEISPLVLTGGTMISGAIGLVCLSLFDPLSHWNDLVRLHPLQWFALLFLALACSVLAYFAYNAALRNMDASRVAVSFYVEPVVALLLGVTLLGEQLTWQTILGAIAILGSVIAVNLIKR